MRTQKFVFGVDAGLIVVCPPSQAVWQAWTGGIRKTVARAVRVWYLVARRRRAQGVTRGANNNTNAPALALT